MGKTLPLAGEVWMPGKECSVVDERLRFVAQLLDGEAMSEVCRAFGISRKTGYKIFERYKEHGLEALTDRSRRPVRYANPLPRQIESLIVAAKRDKPHLGCPQDPRAPGPPTGRRHPRSRQEHDPRRAPPARPGQDPGTAAAPGDRHAALDRRCAKRPLVRRFQEPAPAKAGGEFKLGNGRYCFPLTVTDHASRFLLLCEALESTRENLAITAFEQLFQERGLPQAIRSDNGVPFASPNGLFNLSKLSVWWLRLGIVIERIKPGHPQQNGRHERMHLTLKKEATRPPGMNSLQQQARFDDFVQEFNTERPHEALAMKCPAEIYSASSRPYSGLPDLTYPLHDRDVLVTACGRICMHRKRVNISTVLAGQRLGIKEVDDDIWIVSFMHYDLGFIDLEQKTLQPLDNPFGTGLSPMSYVRPVTYVHQSQLR